MQAIHLLIGPMHIIVGEGSAWDLNSGPSDYKSDTRFENINYCMGNRNVKPCSLVEISQYTH